MERAYLIRLEVQVSKHVPAEPYEKMVRAAVENSTAREAIEGGIEGSGLGGEVVGFVFLGAVAEAEALR